MAEEIVRLKKEDYDELIGLLDHTFGTKYKRRMSFEEELPKMCRRTDERMGRHLGLRVDGKLCAALGIYPLPARIAGEEILFSTVGNVVTHPDHVGKGYMTRLVKAAMEELARIGADGSRLGGKRTRYHRYGYDPAGTAITYSLDLAQWQCEIPAPVSFRLLERKDEELLEQAKTLQQSGAFVVDRPDLDDFYDSLLAWKNIPYAAMNEKGEMIGYVSASRDDAKIVEIESYTLDGFKSILYGWLSQRSPLVDLPMMPHLVEQNEFLLDVCAKHTVAAPCQFKIINWAKIVNATLKLKASYTPLPKMEKIIEVEGYGKMQIRTGEGLAECKLLEDCDCDADISLSWEHANIFFFGPSTMTADRLGCGGVFPLPLSWNLQDRV